MLRLARVPQFAYNLRRPAAKKSAYDIELIQYKKQLNQYRSQLVKSYWHDQTILENQYIENFLEKEKQKARRLQVFRRTQVVLQSYRTNEWLKFNEKKQQERQERLNKFLIEQDIKKMNRQQILKILKEESKGWFDEENLEYNLVSQLVIPDRVIDEVSYYDYLSQQATLLEAMDLEGLDNYTKPDKLAEWKNRLAIPLFQRIISILKYLKQYNIANKLDIEWEACRSIILQDKSLSPSEIKEQLSKIDSSFQSIISERIEGLESNPVFKLQELHKQLLRLYNLQIMWDKYISIIKLDDEQARIIVEGEKEEIDLFTQTDENDADLFKNVNKVSIEKDKEEYFSADEKHTSSDEEVDIEQFMKQKSKSKQEITPEQQEADQQQKQFIQSLLEQGDQKGQQAVIKFNQIINQDPQRQVLYSTELNDEKIASNSIFNGVDLDNLFPKDLIEQSNPYLNFKTLKDIENDYQAQKKLFSKAKEDQNIIDDPDQQRFNTLVIGQIYKQNLQNLNVPEEYQQMKNETLKLVDVVSETKIDEPLFLLQLWKYYK
ncbi:hypothetical protein pb186bvf_011728 [Paramecium bursaria]